MNNQQNIVAFDPYGVFEVTDTSLFELVGAGAVDGPVDSVASNTVCVNGGCFSVNGVCPTQKICGQFYC